MKILVATHGGLAGGFKSALQMMCENLEDIIFLSLDDEGQVAFEQKIIDVFEKFKEDDVLVLVDILGGSPFLTTQKNRELIKGKVEIVAGINFSMLLDAYFSRDKYPFDELVDKIINSAIDSISVAKYKTLMEDDE